MVRCERWHQPAGVLCGASAVFCAHARHPTDEGWEDREAQLFFLAGARWDYATSGGGCRELWWYCDTLSEAVVMRDVLATVGGVTVTAREL